MKPSIKFLFIILITIFSCQKQDPLCSGKPTKIQRTDKLAVGSKLTGFGGCPENTPCFAISELKGNFILLYFKKVPRRKDGYYNSVFNLNEKIENKSLWEAVKNKNGNIIINNNLKMAYNRGVEVDEKNGYQFKHNTLFIMNKNKIITHIYIDICEEDIIKLVNEKL